MVKILASKVIYLEDRWRDDRFARLDLATGDWCEDRIANHPEIHKRCSDGRYMHMNEEIVAHYNIEGSTFIWFRGESYLVPANAKADRRRLTDEMASFSLLIDGRELAVLQYKLPDLSLFEYPYDVLTEPPEYEDFFLYLKNTINDGSLFRQANKPYHFGDFMSVRKEGVWKKMKRVFEGK